MGRAVLISRLKNKRESAIYIAVLIYSKNSYIEKTRGSFRGPVRRSICFSSKNLPSKTFVPKYHFLCFCFLFACHLSSISIVFPMTFPSIFLIKSERKLNRIGMNFHCFIIHFGVAHRVSETLEIDNSSE